MLSVTELEFNEAQRLSRPIFLFIMGDTHPLTKADIERDPDKETKLNAFRERAKKSAPGSAVNRVYATFNSLEDFKDRFASSLSDLKEELAKRGGVTVEVASTEKDQATSIPIPPAFYAEPDYIGSHKFVGRESQLGELTKWAQTEDENLLLFQAIGGNGKSMLTWEWTTNPKHALSARSTDSQWAGRFWYSFYERGAIMADFCRHALAYMTSRPLEDFAKKRTPELAKDLLAQLHLRPWLLILDGLERVLVAYHRIDAAEVPDEEANTPTDKIVNRNPCDAIRDEDNDLLRALAGAKPSKILVSSRLIPRVLLNAADVPIPGVRPIVLPGLDEVDAEKLLRSCNVTGSSASIRYYLKANCDNHPLVIGILGGLINHYRENRGNFDAWVADPHAGAALDLGKLDLIQRRNHILATAIKVLSPESNQLLSTLALISESVDYETLKAFNPHLPPEPEKVEKPEPPQEHYRWNRLSDADKAEWKKEYDSKLVRWQGYENAVNARLASVEFLAAPNKLEATVTDLEQRGLLQYDSRSQRYDLHPVVRCVAAAGMKAEEKQRHGQRVVDHFTAQPHRPYNEAETMDDLRSGIHVVRTFLKLGQLEQAAKVYRGELSNALSFNLESYAEVLFLLRYFFPTGWDKLPTDVPVETASYLANAAAVALECCGEQSAAVGAFGAALRANVAANEWRESATNLGNISFSLSDQNRIAQSRRVNSLAMEIATLSKNQGGVFISRLRLFVDQSKSGQWADAAATWRLLDPMGRAWSRDVHRPGSAELRYAKFHFCQGTLLEEHLAEAERLAVESNNRITIRNVHRLRGDWRLSQGEWALAAASYQGAVRLARERGMQAAFSQAGLALAKFHLGQLSGDDARNEAERLAQLRQPGHRYLAMLLQAIDDTEQATHYALSAYKWAWADGEPYVLRYELTKTTELLKELNVPIPNLPPYDPAKDEPFPWEAEVRAAIEKLRAEKAAKK